MRRVIIIVVILFAFGIAKAAIPNLLFSKSDIPTLKAKVSELRESQLTSNSGVKKEYELQVTERITKFSFTLPSRTECTLCIRKNNK